MSQEQVRLGTFRGTGAAVNISLGWIPDAVIISNITDGNKQIIGWPGRNIMPFSSAGPTIVQAGDYLVGTTSKAVVRVKDVILDSGTFAGSNAAGWFVLDRDTLVGGPFQSETVYEKTDTAKTAIATVTANIDPAQVISAVATSVGIVAYNGSQGSASKGFTVASSVSTANKLFDYIAFRNGDGSDGRNCENSLALS